MGRRKKKKKRFVKKKKKKTKIKCVVMHFFVFLFEKIPTSPKEKKRDY